MASRPTHTPGQLGLGLQGHQESIGIECRGIFSALYLRNALTASPDFPSEAEARHLYEAVKARWLKNWFDEF